MQRERKREKEREEKKIYKIRRTDKHSVRFNISYLLLGTIILVVLVNEAGSPLVLLLDVGRQAGREAAREAREAGRVREAAGARAEA